MEVAGADLGPGVGYADDGLVEVFFAEAYAAEVGAGCGTGMGPSVRGMEYFFGL